MANVLGGVAPPSSLVNSFIGSEGRVLTAQIRGDQVGLRASPLSLFQSAAEEMSFARSTIKSSDLKSRTISGRATDARVRQIEELRRRVDSAEGLQEGEEFRPFLKQLLNQSNMSGTQIRQLAGQQFTDVSQQFQALSFLRDWLRRLQKKKRNSALAGLIDAVDEATEALLANQGSAIHAGINIQPVASSFAGDQLGSVNQLRQFYRDAVLDYGSLGATFRKIVEQYGEDGFAGSLGYLVRALGADLASEGPSMPRARLKMIIEDLFKLQSLESLGDETKELLAQLGRLYEGQAIPTRLQVMGELLSLLDKTWIRAVHLNTLAESLKIMDGMAIYFLTGLKELIRMLPLKAFNEEYERDNLLASVQECLDQRIEAEEMAEPPS